MIIISDIRAGSVTVGKQSNMGAEKLISASPPHASSALTTAADAASPKSSPE